jgi:hypothetical protein
MVELDNGRVWGRGNTYAEIFAGGQ